MPDTVTVPDLDEVIAAYAVAAANPESHNQAWYARYSSGCGTTLCLAGHILDRAGGVPEWDLDDDWATSMSTDYFRMPDGTVGPAFDLARALIGLEHDDAEMLFLYAHDLTRVREAILAIAVRRHGPEGREIARAALDAADEAAAAIGAKR